MLLFLCCLFMCTYAGHGVSGNPKYCLLGRLKDVNSGRRAFLLILILIWLIFEISHGFRDLFGLKLAQIDQKKNGHSLGQAWSYGKSKPPLPSGRRSTRRSQRKPIATWWPGRPAQSTRELCRSVVMHLGRTEPHLRTGGLVWVGNSEHH